MMTVFRSFESAKPVSSMPGFRFSRLSGMKRHHTRPLRDCKVDWTRFSSRGPGQDDAGMKARCGHFANADEDSVRRHHLHESLVGKAPPPSEVPCRDDAPLDGEPLSRLGQRGGRQAEVKRFKGADESPESSCPRGGLDRGHRMRVLLAKDAVSCPPQRRQVGPAAERAAQVECQRPDVCSTGTNDPERRAAVFVSEDLKALYPDATRGQLRLLSSTRERVRALSTHLLGAPRRGDLRELTGE